VPISPPPGRSFPVRPVRYFEDLAIGESFDLGGFSVTRDDIIAFARQFDPQPFHLDGAPLSASGWHLGAMTMRLMCEGFLLGSESRVSPGIDKMSWLRPLLADQWWTARLTVATKRLSRSRPDTGLVGVRVDLAGPDGALGGELHQTILWTRDPSAAGPEPEGARDHA